MTDQDPRRKTLFHGRSSNLCGWCHYHHAGLTPHQLKIKKCLGKQCKALQRFTNHPYWKQRDFIKAQKAKRKAERNGEA